MNLGEAMVQVFKGRKICKPGWNNGVFVILAYSRQGLVTENGIPYEIDFTDFNSDWTVYKERPSETKNVYQWRWLGSKGNWMVCAHLYSTEEVKTHFDVYQVHAGPFEVSV